MTANYSLRRLLRPETHPSSSTESERRKENYTLVPYCCWLFLLARTFLSMRESSSKYSAQGQFHPERSVFSDLRRRPIGQPSVPHTTDARFNLLSLLQPTRFDNARNRNRSGLSEPHLTVAYSRCPKDHTQAILPVIPRPLDNVSMVHRPIGDFSVVMVRCWRYHIDFLST
jgi:hypothetical protein